MTYISAVFDSVKPAAPRFFPRAPPPPPPLSSHDANV
jgi:hypothetical protein